MPGLFCEHLDVFSETFPTSGMTRSGTAYELPTSERHTGGSASSLLPTQQADTSSTVQYGKPALEAIAISMT